MTVRNTVLVLGMVAAFASGCARGGAKKTEAKPTQTAQEKAVKDAERTAEVEAFLKQVDGAVFTLEVENGQEVGEIRGLTVKIDNKEGSRTSDIVFTSPTVTGAKQVENVTIVDSSKSYDLELGKFATAKFVRPTTTKTPEVAPATVKIAEQTAPAAKTAPAQPSATEGAAVATAETTPQVKCLEITIKPDSDLVKGAKLPQGPVKVCR